MPDTFEVLCSLQVIIQIVEIGQSNKEITALKVSRDKNIFSSHNLFPFYFSRWHKKKFFKITDFSIVSFVVAMDAVFCSTQMLTVWLLTLTWLMHPKDVELLETLILKRKGRWDHTGFSTNSENLWFTFNKLLWCRYSWYRILNMRKEYTLILKIQGPTLFHILWIQICWKKQRKKKIQTSFLLPDASLSNSFLLISVVKCLTLARNGTQSEKSWSLPSEAESTNKHLTLTTDCFLWEI